MRQKISAALAEAVADGDRLRTGTLRLMLAALKDREAALGDDDRPGELDERLAMDLFRRMVAQRQRAIEALEQAGRMELAEREREEIRVIEAFLPRPLSDREAAAAVETAIRETGARSIRDVGRVMARLKARHAGQMDFAKASARVKALLG